ncbi:MAG: o-succinylbenzoate synthase [Bacteroidota bacterium]|nr:o-succinylbenzoate synthase [Bacteroidota bacterium]
MSLRATFFRKVFTFNFKARTSRGLMKDKTSWFIRIESDNAPGTFGLGECGPLPRLSQELDGDYEQKLSGFLDEFNRAAVRAPDAFLVSKIVPSGYPSITFGMETALLDLANGGQRIIFDNNFTHGTPIPINGLIWMGDLDFMMDQINKKIAEGFRCVKLKVGGLDFDRECDILGYIRRRYFKENIQIRIDANGAFKADDVLFKLEEMARYDIHSVEQPIMPGLGEMEELCRKSPIPVAFDEELIGVRSRDEKQALLKNLKPRFIVLKPTLHGGFSGCEEWIAIAESMNIGWWITSALESSVGLNAICQFTARYNPGIPQGLGTGAIYSNNFLSPLTVRQGTIVWDTRGRWEFDGIS